MMLMLVAGEKGYIDFHPASAQGFENALSNVTSARRLALLIISALCVLINMSVQEGFQTS